VGFCNSRSRSVGAFAEPIMQALTADAYPHLAEMTTEYILQPGYDFGTEFEFGLNLILDALTRSLPNSRGEQPHLANDKSTS